MKELLKHFIGIGEVRGFRFTQLKATNKAYLYEVDVFGQIHYETFKHKVNERFGNVRYPRSRHFGEWAQTTRDFNKALNYFNNYNKGGK